jgi:hypothetical protein
MDERTNHRESRDYRDDRYLGDRDYSDRDYRDRDFRDGDLMEREYRDRAHRESDYRYSASVPVGSKFAAGVTAGIFAAILMMGFLMACSSAIGEGPTMPLKALGALVYGVEALIAGSTAVAAGAGIELGFSIVLGILFGLAMSRRSSVILAMLGGILVGVVTWVAMELYVLPQMDPTMAARIALMPMAYFVAHVLFGIGLGLTPLFVRAFSRERHGRRSRDTQRMDRPASASV